MKLTRIGALAALLLLAAAVAGVLQPGAARSADPTTPVVSGTTTTSSGSTISVSGNGSVTTTPNRGEFTFGVTSPAKTAAAALAANAAAMHKIITAVHAAGVADADTQTSQVSLDVRLSNTGDSVTGYVASSSLTAGLKNLGTAGAVVDAAVSAGADSVYGPSLSTSDTGALYAQALKAAVADARTKAEALAAAAGLTLGRVVQIDEGGGSQPIPLMAASGKVSDGSTSTPIQPGSQQVQASISVTFAAS